MKHKRPGISGSVEADAENQDELKSLEPPAKKRRIEPSVGDFAKELGQSEEHSSGDQNDNLSTRLIKSEMRITTSIVPSRSRNDVDDSSSGSDSSSPIEIPYSVLLPKPVPLIAPAPKRYSLKPKKTPVFAELPTLDSPFKSSKRSQVSLPEFGIISSFLTVKESASNLSSFYKAARDLYPHDDVSTFWISDKQCKCKECSSVATIRCRYQAYCNSPMANPSLLADDTSLKADGKSKLEDILKRSAVGEMAGLLQQVDNPVAEQTMEKPIQAKAPSLVAQTTQNDLRTAKQGQPSNRGRIVKIKKKLPFSISEQSLDVLKTPHILMAENKAEAMVTTPIAMALKITDATRIAPSFMAAKMVDVIEKPSASVIGSSVKVATKSQPPLATARRYQYEAPEENISQVFLQRFENLENIIKAQATTISQKDQQIQSQNEQYQNLRQRFSNIEDIVQKQVATTAKQNEQMKAREVGNRTLLLRIEDLETIIKQQRSQMTQDLETERQNRLGLKDFANGMFQGINTQIEQVQKDMKKQGEACGEMAERLERDIKNWSDMLLLQSKRLTTELRQQDERIDRLSGDVQ